MVLCSENTLDVDFQAFIESLDDAYLIGSVDTSELDIYLKEASQRLKEYLFENESDTLSDMLSSLYPDAKPNGCISYHNAYDQFIEGTKSNIIKKYFKIKNDNSTSITVTGNGKGIKCVAETIAPTKSERIAPPQRR